MKPEILRIDLTNRKIGKDGISKEDERRFIGRVGVGHKIMWDEVPREVSPFDPENKLILASGPLVGTKVPGANRTITIAKSPHFYPETCTVTSSLGRSFSGELRNTGYEVVAIEGKAEVPTCIFLSGEKVEIRDAKRIWGMDAFETQYAVKKDLGDSQVKVV